MSEENLTVDAELHEIDLEILKILWTDLKEKRERPGEVGLTISQILSALSARGFPRTKAAIQRYHLNILKEARPELPALILRRKGRGKGKVGDRPYIYRLDADNIITWPSTAFMLEQLWLSPVQSIEKETFVKRMLKQGIKNSYTEAIADEDEINRQLRTAGEWGYISYFNNTVMHPGPRLGLEYPYLKFVADQLK